MNEQQLLAALKRLAEGGYSPAEWLEWWEHNAPHVKKLLPAGEFLRLKPRVASHGETAVVRRCHTEAIAILQKRGVTVSPSEELKMLFRADEEARAKRTSFAAHVIEVVEDELRASCPSAFRDTLYEEYLASGQAAAEHDWIRQRLMNCFISVHKPPDWVGDPEWAFDDLEPMVFIEQIRLDETPVTKSVLTWHTMLYIFGRRVACEGGFEMKYEIVAQSW
mgnify:CR=1 FL=1